MNEARNNCTKREICSNFNNSKKMWEVINKLTGRVINAVDEVLLKSFRIKAKQVSDKFAQEFEVNVKNVLNTCDELLLNDKKYINNPAASPKFDNIIKQKLYKIICNINENKESGA